MKQFLLKELDAEPDVVSLFQGIVDLPGSILLDSGMLVEGMSRYSYMSADPFIIITSRGNRVRIEKRRGPGAGRVEIREGNPLDIIGDLLRDIRLDPEGCPFPFFGGAAGFFAYDLGRQLEKIPELAADDTGTPDCWLGFYDVVAAVDRLDGKVYITSTGLPRPVTESFLPAARERLEWLEGKLLAGAKGGQSPGDTPLVP
ncbi:MAG: hypothetical protein ACYC4H_14950, partial [Desulfocucumaceae bacterium]